MKEQIKKIINNLRFNKLTKKDDEIRKWDKFYGNDNPKHLEYQEGSMYDALKKTKEKNPSYIAYNYYGKKGTYNDLYNKIEKTAKALKQIGAKTGDDILICMPNTPEAVIMFYAINKIGCVASLIHPLSSEKEIEYCIKKSNSKYILCLDISIEKVLLGSVNTSIKRIIAASVSESMPLIIKILYNLTDKNKVKIKENDKIITYEEFIKESASYHGQTLFERKALDEAVILYSGGTTGEPKAVVLSNLNFNALALQCFTMTNAKEKDNILTIMPIFHGFGIGVCIHTAILNGMSVTLIPRFKSNEFSKLINKYKPQFLAGVPTMYEALTNSKAPRKKYLSCVKNVICGGDTLTEKLKNKTNDYLKKYGSTATIRVGYGLTECTGASCLTPNNYFKEGAIGVPFPDTIYKIVKPNTTIECKTNEEGEICISGPTVMTKYLNNKDETENTLKRHFDNKIWLHTKDIGLIDEDGIVCFKSRIKRIIVTSGYNIYPSYIEKITEGHPAIKKCAVVSIPHPYKMQVAKAYLVLERNFSYDENLINDLKKYLQKYLSKYSIPYEYEKISELPTTKLGKIDYKKLEEKSSNKKNS